MRRVYALVFVLTLSTQISFSQNCMGDWQYAMPITVINLDSDTLNDFQIVLSVATDSLINGGKLQANGEDLRFTTGNCCNILCHNIESGINSANTVVVVKVPQILPSDSITLMMHYGNNSALAADDPDCVYEFWDDFNANSFNTTKWENQGNLSITQAGGTITFNGQSNWAYIRSTTQFTDMVLIRERRQALGVSAANVLGYTNTHERYTFRQGTANLIGTTHDNNVSGGNAFWNQNYPGVDHPANVFHEFAIRAEIENNFITVYDYCNTSTSNCNTTKTALNQYSGSSFYVGYSSYSPSFVGEADWVYVTKATDTMPTYTFQAEVTATPGPISLGNDTAFCQGDSLTLSPNGTWPAYTWNTNDTTASITVNTSGNYSVTVTNEIGCDIVDTVDVTVNPLPDATFTSSNTGTTYDFTNTEAGGSTWEWDFGDGDTSSAQNPTHTYGSEGTFVVCLTVTDTNGCQSTHCDSIDAAFPSSIGEQNLVENVKVYPNPASEILTIDLGDYNGQITMELYSIQGKQLLKTIQLQQNIQTVDLSSLSNGHYLLKFISSKQVHIEQISVNR